MGRCFLALALMAAGALTCMAVADERPRPSLLLNQDYLENLSAPTGIDIEDPMAVFDFVLAALPSDVVVYPTENYFYFSFYQDGIKIDGNIRLDALDRDDGIVHFAYFSSYTRWNLDLVTSYRKLDGAAGVSVEKRDRLVYDVSRAGRTVRFRLNDLSQVRPDPALLVDGEEYIGPVYDESGLSFFFIYNRDLKLFHFVLNEEVSAPELYLPSPASDRVLIGQRTGFAFIDDKNRPRRILIGVYDGNSIVNNYFDGPFDQLPDNFIEGNRFHDMLVHAFPAVAGRIDRFGNSEGGASRMLITPYIYYARQEELAGIVDCADAAGDESAAYYTCFNTGQPDYNALAASPASAGE